VFANVIGQSSVKNALEVAVMNESLSPASFFWGGSYGGKLTVALELARILTCTGSKEWQCVCSSCKLQKQLLHPTTYLLGGRYFMLEIERSADVLVRLVYAGSSKLEANQFLFLRAVRKLLRRFDAILWDYDDEHLKKARSLLTPTEELLSEMTPGKILNEKTIKKKLDIIISHCADLAKIMHGYSVNVGQVRAINHSMRSLAGEQKVIIIEEAGLMLESSRNALLKILEEPPIDLHFILINETKSAIMPTLLSRMRSYHFAKRSAEEEKRVLAAIFKVGHYTSLDSFFAGEAGVEVLDVAQQFYTGQRTGQPFTEVYHESVIKNAFKPFLQALSALVEQDYKEEQMSASEAQSYQDRLKYMNQQASMYNQNGRTLCEDFYFNK
jgi:DNA polymerase-3 subunit gamma/tau